MMWKSECAVTWKSGRSPPRRPLARRRPGVPYPRTFEWPVREEWALRRRTFNAAYTHNVGVSQRASAYGSSAEIAAAIAELDAILRDLGRRLRDANRSAGALAQRSGEREDTYTARWLEMSAEERQLGGAVYWLQADRRCTRKVLNELCNDWLLIHPRWFGPDPAAFRLLLDRYWQVEATAFNELRQQVESQPVDDQAWTAELRRRERVDAYLWRCGVTWGL